eukprot:6067553-Prymnesium_polylepis.1
MNLVHAVPRPFNFIPPQDMVNPSLRRRCSVQVALAAIDWQAQPIVLLALTVIARGCVIAYIPRLKQYGGLCEARAM